MLIFGGWNGSDFFNDLFLLDLEVMAWTQPKCSGNFILKYLILLINYLNFLGSTPSPRQGHTAIQVGSNLIIQGGFIFD
jgi:hypothetical protein